MTFKVPSPDHRVITTTSIPRNLPYRPAAARNASHWPLLKESKAFASRQTLFFMKLRLQVPNIFPRITMIALNIP